MIWNFPECLNVARNGYKEPRNGQKNLRSTLRWGKGAVVVRSGKGAGGNQVLVGGVEGVFCTACYTFFERESLPTHLSKCTRVIKKIRLEMPDAKETDKFKDHAFTEKTPFICLLDFECFLCKSKKKHTLHDHKLAAGFYIILNKSRDIVASDYFFVSDIDKADDLKHRFINPILSKFRELMIEEVARWNDTHVLTDAD